MKAHPSTNVEMKSSSKYGIRTRYLRTTYESQLPESFEFEEIMVEPPESMSEVRLKHCISRSSSIMTSMSALLRKSDVLENSLLDKQPADILRDMGRLLRLGSKPQLYLWLTQQDFDILSHEDAQPIIGEWL